MDPGPRQVSFEDAPPKQTWRTSLCGRWLGLLLSGGLLLSPGCQGGNSPDSEEHAHHDIPAHHPRTYAAAVRGLRNRLDELAPRRPDPAITPARLEQFADLLQWLPGLALETDMTQQPWNRLAESVRRAERLLATHRDGLLEASPASRQEFRTGFEPELALWDELLSVATDQIFRPPDAPSADRSTDGGAPPASIP